MSTSVTDSATFVPWNGALNRIESFLDGDWGCDDFDRKSVGGGYLLAGGRKLHSHSHTKNQPIDYAIERASTVWSCAVAAAKKLYYKRIRMRRGSSFKSVVLAARRGGTSTVQGQRC